MKKVVAIPLAALMAMNAAPIGLAQAKMVTTEQLVEQTGPKDDRARVLQIIERDDVRQQLIELDVDPAEAAERVRAMSDSEIQVIAGRLDTLPAGGNPYLGPFLLAVAAAVAIAALLATAAYFIVDSLSDD